MPLVIVRHASAGSKAAWAGDDLARPLDPGGAAAAQVLAGLLARIAPAARVISSPAARCVQTVAPFAAQVRRRVEQAPCGARLLDLTWTGFPAGIIAE
jgi:8-oxo-(d)GTP phosphatase